MADLQPKVVMSQHDVEACLMANVNKHFNVELQPHIVLSHGECHQAHFNVETIHGQANFGLQPKIMLSNCDTEAWQSAIRQHSCIETKHN